MSAPSQALTTRLAVAFSAFALVMVAVVAATNGDGKAAVEATSAGPVAVALSEFSIDPGTVTVPKGGSLTVTNNGTVDHDVLVTGTSLKSPMIAAGGSADVDLSSLDPGTYELFCDVPGHKDSGMKATLTVTDGGPGSVAASELAAPAGDGEPGDGGHDMSTMSASDMGSMDPNDPMTKRINRKMEDDMSEGVKTFLSFADRYAAGTVEKGNEKIEPVVLADGTKRFNLTAAITDWEVSPGKIVKAWTYNGKVPGPWLRVEPGDTMEVVLHNQLPVSTDIHWHGVDTPNDQDGLAPITQPFIRPNETFTYRFTVSDQPQLGMYHAHMHGQEAIVNGLFAMVQVGDVALPEGRTINNVAVPNGIKIAQEVPMVLNDAGVIGLSLNGKAFPETEPIVAKKGDWILLHYYNEGLAGHPMHLHRQPHLVVAKDGYPLAEPYRIDTLWVSPGERYSVLIQAEEPGTWAFHCHIVNHAEGPEGLMGMVTAMIVK